MDKMLLKFIINIELKWMYNEAYMSNMSHFILWQLSRK
jgi:hypothetical protein